MVEYSDKVYVEFNLDEYYDLASIREFINLIKPSGGATSSTKQAIEMVRLMFSPQARSRPGVPKVLVIVTDGEASVGDDPKREADLFARDGGRALVVSIGEKPDLVELGGVVSQPKSLYSVVQGSSLDLLVPSVVKDILKPTKGTALNYHRFRYRYNSCDDDDDGDDHHDHYHIGSIEQLSLLS